jgi:hypothetical protein
MPAPPVTVTRGDSACAGGAFFLPRKMKIARTYGVKAHHVLRLLNSVGDADQPADADELVSAENACTICKTKASKYTCPRCFLRYCGVACFQQHGVQCTESFYKEQVGSKKWRVICSFCLLTIILEMS